MRKIFPILAIAVGIFWIVLSFRYGLWVRRGPGGGFFPLIGGAITVVFGLFYLIGEIRNPKPASIDPKFLHPILAVLAVLLCSYAVGLVPSMFLFILLWLLLYEKYSFKLSLSLSAGTMAVLYSVFVYWLMVPLPKGWLGEYFLG